MDKKIYPFDLYERYFSAFSAHAVEYKGAVYPTAEHAYHCQRYSDPAIVEEIKNARSPRLVWELSQKYKSHQLTDFMDRRVKVMEDICRAKAAQHKDVREELLASKDDLIIKNYPDPVWGIGQDGVGTNELGKLWMRLREELQRGTTSA
jgi:N-glycosidase YbiA